MIFFEVLVEGSSDVPTVREVLRRKFQLVEKSDFRIHAHRGKGRLPVNPLQRPDPGRDFLLEQLPIKLRNYGKQSSATFDRAVIVLVDADDDNCVQLKHALEEMLKQLDARPANVLFRIAVEETESWFLADSEAVLAAYPRSNLTQIRKTKPDTICGAWECLAKAIGEYATDPDGRGKTRWAESIAPHLNLNAPESPSFRAFIDGIGRLVESRDK